MDGDSIRRRKTTINEARRSEWLCWELYSGRRLQMVEKERGTTVSRGDECWRIARDDGGVRGDHPSQLFGAGDATYCSSSESCQSARAI